MLKVEVLPDPVGLTKISYAGPVSIYQVCLSSLYIQYLAVSVSMTIPGPTSSRKAISNLRTPRESRAVVKIFF